MMLLTDMPYAGLAGSRFARRSCMPVLITRDKKAANTKASTKVIDFKHQAEMTKRWDSGVQGGACTAQFVVVYQAVSWCKYIPDSSLWCAALCFAHQTLYGSGTLDCWCRETCASMNINYWLQWESLRSCMCPEVSQYSYTLSRSNHSWIY